ncbi:sulfotransferase 1A1-like [Pecten maximus]|uniref:sulfotransferase 1A1-like n=1 Tax=Pecten maximus TaxID=6579 RepID=UPI0014586CA7|nr:sulfotransferase 1A1-like [Pecten maximus]
MARQGKVKIVHVLRNPKDTIVSYYEHYKRVVGTINEGDFNGFFNFCLSDEFGLFGGSWFSYVREWEKAKLSNQKLNVLFLEYEDIKQNLYGTITRLVEFLQLNRPESFLCEVKRAVEFANLQKEHETKAGETKIWNSLGNGGRLPIYWKGCVEDWKNCFTVAQNERFDAMLNKDITEYGIDLNFSYE